jgi:multidrug efflux system outer membrane protein
MKPRPFAILCLSFLFVFATAARAADPITITTSELRERLPRTRTVLLEFNRVHAAKDQINVARGNLFPSVNLGAFATAATNPVFLLSQVEFLLPFLVPSKWFDFAESRHLYESERLALTLLKLNLYASTASMASTFATDSEVSDVYAREALDDTAIVAIAERHPEKFKSSDLDDARTAMHMARVHQAKTESLVVTEGAAVRSALNIPPHPGLQVAFADVMLPPSEFEGGIPEKAAQWSLERAPELRQMQELLLASRARNWSKRFSFLTGFSVRDFVAPGTSVNFGTSEVYASSQVQFGFALFPAMRLAARDLERIIIQMRSLEGEIYRIAEVALGQIQLLEDRVRESEAATQSAERSYQSLLVRLIEGKEDPSMVTSARSQWRDTEIEWLQARNELNLARITLHRLTLTSEFAKIDSCLPAPKGRQNREEREAGIREGRYCREEVVPLPLLPGTPQAAAATTATMAELAKPLPSGDARPLDVPPKP